LKYGAAVRIRIEQTAPETVARTQKCRRDRAGAESMS
jgi:hypothetical protein